MIISASRRTDIPCFYADWFYNRIQEQYVLVRNPMNARQVSRLSLKAEDVEALVFWTKNPKPMLKRLAEIGEYTYYFQFTLNGYGKTIEPGLPNDKKALIETFKRLSDQIGPEKVIWRYDPIFVNEQFTRNYHIETFGEIAHELRGVTDRCHFSFLDAYLKIQKNMAAYELGQLEISEQRILATQFAKIGKEMKIQLVSCSETISLEDLGIAHGKCIDDVLITKLSGKSITFQKDKTQRETCGCMTSVDIGTYNTCQIGCKYCYANYSGKSVSKNVGLYDKKSALLCGALGEADVVRVRPS